MAAASVADVFTKIWLVPLVREIVNPILLLLSAAAFVVFLWGIFTYIRNAADENERERGRRSIGWGLIGLVIIFGSYKIIDLALATFNLPAVQKISTLAENVGGGATSCSAAGAKTGTGVTGADTTAMIAGSAKVEANTGANSCAALIPDTGDTYKEVALDQCPCSDTSGVVCCGEFPPGSGETVEVLPSPMVAAGLFESIRSAITGIPAGCDDSVTGQTTWSGGIAALKSLMQSCPVEVTAKFGENGFDPDTWFDFSTGNPFSVYVPATSAQTAIENPGQYLTPDGKPIPDYGLIHVVHTHPKSNGFLYDPPSAPDIVGLCSILAKLLTASSAYGSRYEFDVVAPEGLYVFTCLSYSQKYVQPFTSSQEPWSSADIAAYLALGSSVDSAINAGFPIAQYMALQNTYLGVVSSNADGSLTETPSGATDAEKQQAVNDVLTLYRSLGVSISFTPW